MPPYTPILSHAEFRSGWCNGRLIVHIQASKIVPLFNTLMQLPCIPRRSIIEHLTWRLVALALPPLSAVTCITAGPCWGLYVFLAFPLLLHALYTNACHHVMHRALHDPRFYLALVSQGVLTVTLTTRSLQDPRR